jgi:hypothetical protein
MSKLLFGAFVALLVLLVLPGAVSAATSDTVTVTGSIGGYIDVSVTANTLDFGTMTVGGSPYSQSTAISVSSSYTSWGVDASDEKAANKGYMVDGTKVLGTAFLLGKDGASYTNIASPIVDYMSGSAGTATATVNAQQSVIVSDQQGSYSITVTFTGKTK